MFESFADYEFHLNELANSWKPKKDDNLQIANLYNCISRNNKAAAVRNCGQQLVFGQNILPSGEIEGQRHLMSAQFCKDRFCPICSWRRSIKNVDNLCKVCSFLLPKYSFRFLTLTIRNTASLAAGLDQLLKGWYVFSKSKIFKRHVFGYHRSLEITYNEKSKSWHPHLHIMIAVSKNYGKKGHDFWEESDVLKLWQSAADDDLITQVKISVPYYKDDAGVKHYAHHSGRLSLPAIIESCKYESKDCIKYSPGVFRELVNACTGRRFYSYGGCMKAAFAKLGLEDIESDYVDLIQSKGKLLPELSWYVTVYTYSPLGYKMKDSIILTPEERSQLNIKRAG